MLTLLGGLCRSISPGPPPSRWRRRVSCRPGRYWSWTVTPTTRSSPSSPLSQTSCFRNKFSFQAPQQPFFVSATYLLNIKTFVSEKVKLLQSRRTLFLLLLMQNLLKIYPYVLYNFLSLLSNDSYVVYLFLSSLFRVSYDIFFCLFPEDLFYRKWTRLV